MPTKAATQRSEGRLLVSGCIKEAPSVHHSEGLGCPVPVCAVMEPYFFKEYVLAVQLLHFIGIVEFLDPVGSLVSTLLVS